MSHTIIDKDLETLTVIAIDGRTMRGSHNKIRDEKARHIVSLFATKEKVTLAQKEVDDEVPLGYKSNEIPALLELLDSLKLQDCVITMDAMHTHEIPQKRGPKNSKQDLKKAS